MMLDSESYSQSMSPEWFLAAKYKTLYFQSVSTPRDQLFKKRITSLNHITIWSKSMHMQACTFHFLTSRQGIEIMPWFMLFPNTTVIIFPMLIKARIQACWVGTLDGGLTGVCSFAKFLIFKLLADGVKLLAMDSLGVLAWAVSLKGAARVQEGSFMIGGCSLWRNTIYEKK